jgi:nitrogen regulatory protein PII
MMRITADIKDEKTEEVLRDIALPGVRRVRVFELREESGEYVEVQTYRGTKYRPLVPKTRIEVDVPDSQAESLAKLIAKKAYTGKRDDGTVALLPIYILIDVRTGESINDPIRISDAVRKNLVGANKQAKHKRKRQKSGTGA